MMDENAELILEGSYLYFQDGVNFSQENFKLVQLQDFGQYHIYAEILSRIETGEFLKVIVRYEMTNHFIPFFVRIEKSIGDKYAQETFRSDLNAQELYYTFQGQDMTQEFKKSHSSKHYLASPSFATSAIWTLSKKMDPTGRTPVTLVSTSNYWAYESAPQDKIVYADIRSREAANFKLNNVSLSASHICLFEHDSIATTNELPTELFISKYFAIPYQLIQGNMRIDIQSLKKHG